MTTHDPLVISGLEAKDVRILELDRESGNIRVVPPDEAPQQMGYSEILTSDIFKLRAVVSPKTQELLSEKRQLASKADLTVDERIRLETLNIELEDFDFTTVERDPLYGPFVEAMNELEREEGLQVAVLTREQIDRRRELAREILEDLKNHRKEQ